MTRVVCAHQGETLLELALDGQGGGAIAVSTLTCIDPDREGEEADNYKDYETAVDGIEALVLALACEGIDVSTPAFGRALFTAVETCGNKFT